MWSQERIQLPQDILGQEHCFHDVLGFRGRFFGAGYPRKFSQVEMSVGPDVVCVYSVLCISTSLFQSFVVSSADELSSLFVAQHSPDPLSAPPDAFCWGRWRSAYSRVLSTFITEVLTLDCIWSAKIITAQKADESDRTWWNLAHQCQHHSYKIKSVPRLCT